MPSFDALKVSTRLALGFGAAVLLGLGIALGGAWQMHALADEIDELAHDRMPKIDKVGDVKDYLNVSAQAVRNVLLATDPAVREAEAKRVQAAKADTARLLDELDRLLALPEARLLLKVIADHNPAYQQALEDVMRLAAQGQAAEAAARLAADAHERQTAMFKAVDELTVLEHDVAARLAERADGTAVRSTVLMLAAAGLMAVLGGLAGWALSRSLGRALGAEPVALNAAVRRIAAGDLGQTLALRRGDTTSTLAAVAGMQQALTGIVQTVRGNADSVATASAQIAQGNLDLSARTEEQASALQQTAASMEELGAAVQHSADSAAQANQLAQGASTVAVKGGAVVSEVVATMKSINDASKRIADIIGTIDGIAFQTNILALNAAVEAARAGEQGRGFAVVASEVRSLAQRSAEAAKEIRTLILTNVERVERGSVLVDDAGHTMTEVVAAIRRVTDLMAEVSTASSEQNSGVSQAGEAIAQIDQATQQNAALVEEGAAAAASLREQSRQLVDAVAVFQLAAAGALPAPSAAAASRPIPRPILRPIPRPAPRANAPALRAAPHAPRAPVLAASEGAWAEF